MTQQGLVTTPFGRRTLSLGLIATQQQARAVEPEKTVHKWKIFQAITEAKDRLGLPDRAIAVLSALLSFHQETMLVAGETPIVFPSNEKLCARAHGIAPATLRRHLAALVEAGIVIRRDSPNGKRYARRGMDGEVSLAFGFELTPLIARAEEFEALAAEVQAERRALRLARERITLARRDITKMILLGMEEALPGDWQGLHGQYLALVGRLRRSASLADLGAIAADLEGFSAGILKHLELFTNSPNSSANESHSGRHKQNSKPDLHESEPAFEKDRSDEREADPETHGSAQAGQGSEEDLTVNAATRVNLGTPLPMVLEACPDIRDYIPRREGQGASPPSWSEFLKAAELVRAMLGISPDAWRDAVETMGQADASIVVAAILQKGDEVRFPGGYLRALTEKKREGQFSVGPILMALIGTKLKAMKGVKGIPL
ncbi:MAG: replication initiation protein RepC [Methylobacterium sp.]|nr:replication initiation protein RepC [Methylobacterium sp.]MCA3656979.1 replication initiation protein RepC [Methylobacterium sp.]MCA3663155.1 replication initiation protein RepC [Methylobacterium sp.]MCA3667118.1 replication initiation protein RepC [Methylobacterium sp.]MCA3673338.1 replication initiation protein RepC [Methylobacterium sp.]